MRAKASSPGFLLAALPHCLAALAVVAYIIVVFSHSARVASGVMFVAPVLCLIAARVLLLLARGQCLAQAALPALRRAVATAAQPAACSRSCHANLAASGAG